MLCHLPAPYPDELLYSVIARYLKHNGTANASAVTVQVFGRKKRPCVDLPSSLDVVSKRTWLIWGMTGEEIADQLTLFPYYARYVSNRRVVRCVQELRSDNSSGLHARLGVSAWRVGVPKLLRFCPTCRTSDFDRFGETYWRRAHQIVGVLVCPDHGDLLIESDALVKPNSYGYVDATQSTAHIASPTQGVLDKTDATKAFKIANRCRDMLRGQISPWLLDDMPTVYRKAALERGFSDGPFRLSQRKFENAFVAFFGEVLLARLDCEIQMGKDTNWVRSILRPEGHSVAFHPLQHSLVQIFLESVPLDVSNKIPFGLGPWKCPNPYGRHKETFPLKRISIRRLPSGEPVASAKCSCGFCFTFSRMSSTDLHLPIVKNFGGLGPTWRSEAKRLQRKGLCTTAIAKKMHIDFRTAKNLLEGKSRARRVLSEQIEKWKQEWLKLLDQVPNRRPVLARKTNGRLYMKLWRWDREWLLAQPRFGSSARAPSGRVDWTSRDMEWSKILRAAAQKVKASGPPRRVAPLTIIKASGLSESALSRPVRLPICCAVLKECSESSLDDARERRLLVAVDKACKKGWPRKEWALRYLSGLSGKDLSPRLNAVLEALVSDTGNRG